MSDYTKIELEFLLKSSSKIIYDYIATTDGLSRWFADTVKINMDKTLTFSWDGHEQSVRILSKKKGESIKMQWTDVEDKNVYFQMVIKENKFDSGIALIVIDHPENDEVDEITMLWEKQIQKLKGKIGC